MLQLKDKVGRFGTTGAAAKTGKRIRSWSFRCSTRSPFPDGGAENTLKPQMVATGYASDGLYNSICTSKRRTFPARLTAMFGSAGPTFSRLVELSTKAAAKPALPKGQWDAIATPSVDAALRKGLIDDSKLDYAEIVDIIRATVADGMVTAFELDDLTTIANTSQNALPHLEKAHHALRRRRIQGEARDRTVRPQFRPEKS